ncbi:MAG: outer membrane beta-barrel protein [Cyclobacteriaceae bacterium]|nr:outer membrane beta-barrel protein [Cyclobacteriaceae bacterium]
MRILTLIFTAVLVQTLQAQRVAVQLSPGLGRIFSSGVEGNRSFRISFSIAADYFISDRFSVGPEIVWSGRLKSPFSVHSVLDSDTGIEILEPSSTLSRAKFIRFKYFSTDENNIRLFAAMGLGLNTFSYKEGTDEGPSVLTKENTFAFSPEVGLQFSRNFVISLRYIYAGASPYYAGTNAAQNEVLLEPVQLNPVLISFIYQFHLAKKRE